MPEPIPSPLRSAVIDAMGGWGPFTVREIEGLFIDHGFEASEEVEPEQGVRRTAAAEHLAPIDWADADQRRRLLQLADEILQFYTETDEESPLSPGRRLRRVVTRIRETGSAAVTGSEVQPTTNTTDPFDIWPPGRIRLFFSHTSAHRGFVGDVARVLEYWPFACFVAHDEIEPSLSWQQVIESALTTCDALIAFVTGDFRESASCDQEVGWALGRGLVTIPVSLPVDPHGFTGSIQAVTASLTDDPGDVGESIAAALMTAVFRETRPGSAALIDPLADAIVSQFCDSPSGELARRRFEFLRRLPPSLWTPSRRLQVESAFTTNTAIATEDTESGVALIFAVPALWN